MRKGENGMAFTPTYASSVETPKTRDASARYLASRAPGFRNDAATPLAPIPNRATETTRNAK